MQGQKGWVVPFSPDWTTAGESKMKMRGEKQGKENDEQKKSDHEKQGCLDSCHVREKFHHLVVDLLKVYKVKSWESLR